MDQIRASLAPLLNCHNFSAPGTLHTLITVPLSDAVASNVPEELTARQERGDLWAWMTLDTVSDVVENRITSPVAWCVCELDAELDTGGGVGFDVFGVGEGCGGPVVVEGAERDVGEGTGEGYARYDASADGESAQTATSKTDQYPHRKVRKVINTYHLGLVSFLLHALTAYLIYRIYISRSRALRRAFFDSTLQQGSKRGTKVRISWIVSVVKGAK